MDAVNIVVIAVLGVATGIFGSHATLGKQVTQVLTEMKRVQADIVTLQQDVRQLQARPHFHRRRDDSDLEQTG